VSVSVDLANVGEVAGDEVVQLYVRDEVSSVTTPVQSLKGFQRVPLQPKQSITVTFALNVTKDLAIYNRYLLAPKSSTRATQPHTHTHTHD
jgi:beta-glucosidase